MNELEKARQAALTAYWDAKSHEQEHAALQRMIALGCAGTEYAPCMEPECVAIRAREVEAISLLPLSFIKLRESGAVADIAVVTRDIARGS